MQETYVTHRLLLQQLSTDDAKFIRVLVNTPGWLKFIGDRNVTNDEQAVAYVQKILNNPDVTYWVASSVTDESKLGIITVIKRDYLDHPDIGFAFLPEYTKQGYALEAAGAILNDLKNSHNEIAAITIRENIRSIALLEKLGFRFSREIEKGDELLQLYMF